MRKKWRKSGRWRPTNGEGAEKKKKGADCRLKRPLQSRCTLGRNDMEFIVENRAPFACPLARSLAPLTHSLASHYSLRSRPHGTVEYFCYWILWRGGNLSSSSLILCLKITVLVPSLGKSHLDLTPGLRTRQSSVRVRPRNIFYLSLHGAGPKSQKWEKCFVRKKHFGGNM